MPDGMRQRKHVAAVHLAVALVAGCEIQQGEGVARPLRFRGQSRRTDHRHDAVVENDPVRLLEGEEEMRRESVSTTLHTFSEGGRNTSFCLQGVLLSPGR